MEFQRLRLAGFKSFVDACELRIDHGLTGIVGPNGCGKSNLLEAIRWVMGEGSAKAVRGGGMEDVIFAGTGARPGRDFAEVRLTLDNTARTAPAEMNGDDTIEVVRRIERGLGSAYRVNGRDVRARDVQLLFADAATGAHSPALVSQGRIGAIIAAKPSERRVLLEEAAGISGLDVRRREAEIRLRATEANLLRHDDVIAALDAQVAALKRQAKAAERYRALSERIRATEAALLLARWTRAKEEGEGARTSVDVAEVQVTAATREAVALATARAEAAATLTELRVAEAEAAVALQAVLQTQRTLVAEASAVAARSRDLASTAATVARDRAREDGLGNEAATAIVQLDDEAARLTAVVETAAAALSVAARAVGTAETAVKQGETALSAAIEAHARASASARAAGAALATAEARLATAAGEAARLEHERDRVDLVAIDLRRADAAAALDSATAAAATAAVAVTGSDAAQRAAATARDAANAAMLAARGELAALTVERDAVMRLLASGRQGSLLDRITVAPGDELALAAGYGDDLSATVGEAECGRFWSLSAGDDPPLPAGAVPLRATVPPELARRLAQIGVTESADAAEIAARLRPGQRLVTRDGRLWRWDGFRAFGRQGAATAERLTLRNRLAALDAELPAAAAAFDAARVALGEAEAVRAVAAANEARSRAARTVADRRLDSARATAVAAATDADRATARRDAGDAAITRLRADAAEFARELDYARATAAEISGLPALFAVVTATRAATEAARGDSACALAAHATIVRDRETATARLTALAADRAAWVRRAAASNAQVAELDRRAAEAETEAKTVAARPAAIAAEQADLATRAVIADAVRRAAADALAAAEIALRDFDRAARATAETLSLAREVRARAAADLDHADTRRREIEARCGERFGCSPPKLPFVDDGETDPTFLAERFETLTAERERIGPVNLRADLELADLAATATSSASERADLDTAVARLRGSIGALNREGRVRLLAAFAAVDGHFRDLFGTLFAGGAAHLALVEADDPLEAGLEIMAQPPGKKLQSLTLLSGGEQALTAASLIFALFLTNPAPICVLDEVDAPLDDANVERFCDLLDRMAATTRTRFLIVTHNAVTMSRMHRLYGVTMGEPGVSQLVSVDLRSAEALLAAD